MRHLNASNSKRSPCLDYAPHAAHKLVDQWTGEGVRGWYANALWKLRLLTDECYPLEVRAAAREAIIMLKLERNEEHNLRRMQKLRDKTAPVLYLPMTMYESLPEKTAGSRAL